MPGVTGGGQPCSPPRKIAPRENFLGVFGHTTIDHIMEVPRFPAPNTSIEVRSRRRYHGGTGANIAFLAANMGATVALASFVGDDFPQGFEDALRAASVDITDLVRVKGYYTPACWIVTDSDEQQMAFIDQGPMRDAEGFDVLAHTVDTSRIVHFGTGRPEYYAKVAAYAHAKKRTIALDPAQEIHYVYTKDTFLQMLDCAHILFVNSAELERALEYIGSKSPKWLLDYVEVLLVTLGRKGSRVLTTDGVEDIPAIPPRRMADPTGAGDGYRAGFYAAMERGHEICECALAGAAAASFVIEEHGAQSAPPTWESVLARLREHRCAID
ncbi:MAG: PfkB family carbohydrate kinase [Candidatus Thermoplasmatota archaeon]